MLLHKRLRQFEGTTLWYCRRQQPDQQARVQRSPGLTRCRGSQQCLAWMAPLVREEAPLVREEVRLAWEEVRLAWGWAKLEWETRWWVWSWLMLRWHLQPRWLH